MTNGEREQLKDNMRAMIAGRGDGIDLDSKFRWVLEGICQPEPFFRNLHLLLPADAVLYFEGCTIAPDVSKFYESHRAHNPVAVVRDTIFPVPDCFHVGLSPAVISQICAMTTTRPVSELFYHVKAYQGETLLITFHDAFDGSPCLIADRIAEPAIKEFSTCLSASYSREPNINKRDPEQLRRLLEAMENPDKFSIALKPWWKRILQVFTRK